MNITTKLNIIKNKLQSTQLVEHYKYITYLNNIIYPIHSHDHKNTQFYLYTAQYIELQKNSYSIFSTKHTNHFPIP